MVPVLEHESAIIEENEIRFERIKKKGKFDVSKLLHKNKNDKLY